MLRRWLMMRCIFWGVFILGIVAGAQAGEPVATGSSDADSATLPQPLPEREGGVDAPGRRPSAKRGYKLLTTKAFLPPDFDNETFDNIWQAWESSLREKAAKMSPAERRQVAFARYGLTGLPEVNANEALDRAVSLTPGDSPGAKTAGTLIATKPTSDLQPPTLPPAQYVVDSAGRWTMNCFACHQGRIAGRTIPGLPNSTFALATLTDEVRATKMRLDKPLSRMDLGSLYMPLGNTRGTTNAVMFGVVLMNFRDAELNVHTDRPIPPMVHHDLDAPPWWNYHTKKQLYYDGFVPKGHRALMQFLMVRENGPEKFRAWEGDYRDIEAWLDSLQAPKYPFTIDRPLAATGAKIFNSRCASCHGTYGANGEVLKYPGRVVPLAKVGTDSVRLTALTPLHRSSYAASWFNEFGKQPVDAEPAGYVAPPLSGIWASAPYLHNGSVPTLWHLMHATERPVVWRRLPEGREQEIEGYDQQKVGLTIEALKTVPATATSLRQRREYFDTQQHGKRAVGHTFPEQLSESEKRAVLEYLKTL